MIGFHDAVARLNGGIEPLEAQRVATATAAGRVLAHDVICPGAVPPFDCAAMDGIAIASGGRSIPVGSTRSVDARIGAGEAVAHSNATTWEIMTGAALPAGADTVIPFELLEALEANASPTMPRYRLACATSPGMHIRRRGDDIPMGTLLMRRGDLIDVPGLMLLSGAGLDAVDVVSRPRVCVVVTGQELVAPGKMLHPAGIHDALSLWLAHVLSDAGAEVKGVVQVGDDVASFQRAIEKASASGIDLIVSTGAVSKGCYDFVPRVLDACGAELLFHGVAMRPGKPVLAAQLREGPRYVGLPGNPMAAAVGMRFLIEPMLRAWLGMPEEIQTFMPLAESCRKRGGLHTVVHGVLRHDESGALRAHAAASQASFRLLPYARSSAWIELPAALDEVQAGQRVRIRSYGHMRPPTWSPA